jgi:hypothetical protein
MQRPLHLRYGQDESPTTNKAPYVPTYGNDPPTDPVTAMGQAGYAPMYYYPTNPALASYEGPAHLI